jgi:gluconokinase
MSVHEIKLLVMGVSGCGKSTLAAALARALQAELIEGDEHHTPASQQKMRQGQPLGDADRAPWLDHLGALLQASNGPVVLSCSALKRDYRERLRRAAPGLRTVFIDINEATASARVASRPGHLFPASLVASQFETLQSPLGEAEVLAVSAELDLDAQARAVLRWLGHAAADR